MRAEYLTEAYFGNRLTAEEERELNDLLKRDDELRSEFEIEVEIREAFRKKERRELKERLELLERKSAGGKGYRWLLAAASIVLLLGTTWFLGIYSNQPDYDALYAEHFEVYPNIVAPLERSQTGASPDLLSEAFGQYDSGAFREASLSFREIYKAGGGEFAVFYTGVSLMAMGEYDASIREFKQISEWESRDFAAASKWYLALAYLKKGEKEIALAYLEELQKSKHPLSGEAAELIQVFR